MGSREHTPTKSANQPLGDEPPPVCACGHYATMHDGAGCGAYLDVGTPCPCLRYSGPPRMDRVREVRRKVARGEYDTDRRALEVTAERALEDVLRRSELLEAIREQEAWQMGWSPEEDA